MIIVFLGEKVKYPITLYCDNVGEIYLTYNDKISRRTKHVDTRTHFGQSHVENGTIKIIFVRLEDDDADVFTKNTSENTYNKQTRKFMIENST